MIFPDKILGYLVNRIGSVHQHMDPSAILFFQNTGLKNIFQAGFPALIGTAIIEKARIPCHISRAGKNYAQVLKLKAGTAEIRILPLFGINLKIIQADHQAV